MIQAIKSNVQVYFELINTERVIWVFYSQKSGQSNKLNLYNEQFVNFVFLKRSKTIIVMSFRKLLLGFL